uniref:Predicted protein n=1 Tax=Hordeum vulgare subsp. vulgare TaxID=112509 RepID=F2D6K4_HORVV|nr:predicted protein [Hordeum vulgare subsp. vulgare]
MAAILETSLKSSVNKLQDVITDEAILILGVEEELTKLLRRVELIQCCIYDAEKRRTKEQAVNSWLGQLRDVIYDVDEILDVARCKGSKLLPDDHPSPSSGKSFACKGLSVSSCFCNIVPRRDVAVRIRSLNKKIECIANDKVFLTFNNSTQPIANGQTSELIRSSNLVEPNLVGKEIIHASRKLVDLVLAHKEYKSYKLGIVGTGGVGKTTLAQKIYNDQKIKGSFMMHAWICVSQDYNEVILLKEVLRNVGVHNVLLKEVWVRFYGAPSKVVNDFTVAWSFGSLIGKTEQVDMVFTRANGAVRLLVSVLDSALIPEEVLWIFEGKRFTLRLEIEIPSAAVHTAVDPDIDMPDMDGDSSAGNADKGQFPS